MQVKQLLQLNNFEHIFAAGDYAICKVDDTHDSVMSCQQGRPQSRYAGYNAIAQLYQQEMKTYSQPNYVTCIDLGEYGAIFCEGFNRQVKKFGHDAKLIKQHINRDRIYPPKNASREELLQAGAIEFTPPTATIDDVDT